MAGSQSMPTHWRFQDLTGEKFGSLTVESYAGAGNKGKRTRWTCVCECGCRHEVSANHLRSGKIVSCGECLSQPRSEAHDKWLSGHIESTASKSKTGCWEYRPHLCGKQYRNITINGKSRLAHIVMYEASCGEIPSGMCVCHTCDNPTCVNPSHLFAGTHMENSRDMVSKGRQARGERHGMSKLTRREVAEIRIILFQKQIKKIEIAKKFGVSRDTIRNIEIEKSWKADR